MNRIEAEKRLVGKPVGTYLLHDADKIAEDTARDISAVNHMAIQVLVLTFVEGHQKITERLLIHTKKGWTICVDDSDLSHYKYFPDLDGLLHSIPTLKEKL